MNGLTFFILATYAAQIIQICFFPVPSAGSTIEILFKVKKDPARAHRHPAAAAIRSRIKMTMLIAATLGVAAASLIPLVSIVYPPIIKLLAPSTAKPTGLMKIACIVLLVAGNVSTFAAAGTLRAHVRFHAFGETTRLHTAGIYGCVRNPITVETVEKSAEKFRGPGSGFTVQRLQPMNIGLIIYGTLDTLTGGYISDRILLDYLRQRGHQVEIISLPIRNYASHLLENFSDRLIKETAARQFNLLLQDALCHPSLYRFNRCLREKALSPIVAVVHQVLCRQPRGSLLNRLYEAVERPYLKSVDAFIFNSNTTRQAVEDLIGNRRPSLVAYPAGDRLGSLSAPDKI
ncbi:MAG: hypothetical protein P8X90_26720, partial [Desulfobacterales bacterium]